MILMHSWCHKSILKYKYHPYDCNRKRKRKKIASGDQTFNSISKYSSFYFLKLKTIKKNKIEVKKTIKWEKKNIFIWNKYTQVYEKYNSTLLRQVVITRASIGWPPVSGV